MGIENAGATAEVATGENAALEGLASDVVAAEKPSSWANEETLSDHYDRHGSDFACKSVDDYTAKARAFFRKHGDGSVEVKVDKVDDTIRVYDDASNTFGVYTPDGLTRTFYKPKAGCAYWLRQPGELR